MSMVRRTQLKSELGWISESLLKQLNESLLKQLKESGCHGADGDFVHMNRVWNSSERELASDFLRRAPSLSPYDAIVRPLSVCFHLAGGVTSLPITDDNRLTIIDHSEFALKEYNKIHNKAFVFHQLVKCATGIALSQGDLYYITFEAKANSPAITTFRAKVWKKYDPDIPPELKECYIKTYYTIFVGDLAADVTEYHLKELFEIRYNSVIRARLVTNWTYGKIKVDGFVMFADESEQIKAMTEMQGVLCSGRPMCIGPASNKNR